jgi:hypothetical protein
MLSVATRTPEGAWPAEQVTLPGSPAELDGLAADASGRVSALVRAIDGSWLGLARRDASGWRWRLVARPDQRAGAIGPAGLALDRRALPVIAYASWLPSRKTYLRLARIDAQGKLTTGRITRGGFPSTPTLAGAAPVVLPSGAIRVVETYAPAAIEWYPIPGDWFGQFLHSSALGVPVGSVSALAIGRTVYAAWTEAYPTLGPPAVVLARHDSHTQSAVALEDAVLAGLAATDQGPELAGNRCVPAAAFGTEGNGVCGGIVAGVGVDGLVAGYAALGSTRDVLLATDTGLAWYRSTGVFPVRVTLTRELKGRVDGVTGGSVLLYRERPGQRALLGEFPLAADGSFVGGDPTANAVVAAYRAVYVDRSTGLPYAALVGPGQLTRK